MEIDPSLSSFIKTVAVSLLLLLPICYLPANPLAPSMDSQVDYVMDITAEVVKERLNLLDQSMLEHRFDDAVRRLLAYHLRYPAQTARNVGRAVAYFPIFEAELAAAGLPETLKYLPIIESALRPNAMSGVGAEGLWQFMPETAPEYGLRVDEYIDERLDSYAATQGAIRYLQAAYEYLGDWSLAIAAYNSGKGRVRRAQRRSGGKNFWRVRRYLPRETRNYVPAFIAAVYLTEFFAAHEISPDFPSLDEQLLERVIVEEPISFYRIAQVTELPPRLIKKLNPAYLKGYLPGDAGGHNLVLPQRVVPALRTYLEKYGNAADEPVLPWAPVLQLKQEKEHDQDYQQFGTMVQPGDSLESIAARTRYTASQLAIWNQLTPLDSLVEGQIINYYRPTRYRYLPQREVYPDNHLRTSAPSILTLESQTVPFRQLSVKPQMQLRLSHRIKPSEVLQQYPELDEVAFKTANRLSGDRPLRAGSLLLLPFGK